MKIRYLDSTGNRLELSGEIDKNYVIAPGKKVTFAEGTKFQGKLIATNQSLYNNEYIPKTIGMTVSGKLGLVVTDPPPLLEPDTDEDSDLDEFDYGLERLDDQYRKIQNKLSVLQKENIQLKACIEQARKKSMEKESEGDRFDPAELPPLNIPPETQKFPIIHFQPFSPDTDLSLSPLVRDDLSRSLSMDFNAPSRNFPGPLPLIRSKAFSFSDAIDDPRDSRGVSEPEATAAGSIIQATDAPEQELERTSSSSSLTDIISESGISSITTATDQVTVDQEKEVDISGDSAFSRDNSFCGVSCPIL